MNAFLESHRDRLSLEFRLMKYPPRPWTVTDSLLVGARMVQDLNHYSHPPPLTREKILAKLGPELTADLYVNSSWRDRPPTEMRRMEDEPAANGSDEDEDDDEEVEPEEEQPDHSGRRRQPPGCCPRFALAALSVPSSGRSRFVPAGIEQLGGFRPAHGFREAAALERYAPRPPDAEPVV